MNSRISTLALLAITGLAPTLAFAGYSTQFIQQQQQQQIGQQTVASSPNTASGYTDGLTMSGNNILSGSTVVATYNSSTGGFTSPTGGRITDSTSLAKYQQVLQTSQQSGITSAAGAALPTTFNSSLMPTDIASGPAQAENVFTLPTEGNLKSIGNGVLVNSAGQFMKGGNVIATVGSGGQLLNAAGGQLETALNNELGGLLGRSLGLFGKSQHVDFIQANTYVAMNENNGDTYAGGSNNTSLTSQLSSLFH